MKTKLTVILLGLTMSVWGASLDEAPMYKVNARSTGANLEYMGVRNNSGCARPMGITTSISKKQPRIKTYGGSFSAGYTGSVISTSTSGYNYGGGIATVSVGSYNKRSGATSRRAAAGAKPHRNNGLLPVKAEGLGELPTYQNAIAGPFEIPGDGGWFDKWGNFYPDDNDGTVPPPPYPGGPNGESDGILKDANTVGPITDTPYYLLAALVAFYMIRRRKKAAQQA